MSSNNKLDKFKLLYDDAIKRKQRKDEIYAKCLDSECTFQPDLIKGNNYDSYYTNIDHNFGERLSKPSKTKERSRMQFLHEEKYDESTGQPLFHPKVGRPPLARKDYENIPTTEKLYRDGQHK